MKCKRFRELLFDRAHSDVPAGERAAAAEHLAACPDCSAQAAATGKVLD
ncbi:MAG: hypothetical protein FJ109_15425, partial [Deltaproteobacteria bacterium]|nr:hypothetical protein [Deltaproteobacteria bacterium]